MQSPSKVAPGNTPPRCTYRKFDRKEKLRCRFCRGESCIRCGRDAHKHCTRPAISLFHCNWILDSVLAMQRPSDELFDSIMLIEAFQCNGISAVINLCEPGEHPYCGYPLKSSGFPYTPDRLMAAGIKYFNFYWQDMTAPSLSVAQNTIRVALTEILRGGKVAVHCHAGYGRTGIVVACLALILQQLTAEEAVALVRAQRPGSVQTSTQQAFIRQFHDEHSRQSCVFPSPNKPEGLKSVAASMDDELLSPPLHIDVDSERHSLLTKEELPNAVRLSALVLTLLAPQLGRIGLALSLARLAVSDVRIDRSVSLCTILSSSQDNAAPPESCHSPVKGFIKDNKVQPNSSGALVCLAPPDIIALYKGHANSGAWKKWFLLPSSAADNAAAEERPDLIPGQLCDEDYDQQHIDIEKLLSHFVSPVVTTPSSGADSNDCRTPVKTPSKEQQGSDRHPNMDEGDVDGAPASPDLVTFMACHGCLLLDWLDTRTDALFSPPLLEALRSLKLGDYGPYYFSRRSDVPVILPSKALLKGGQSGGKIFPRTNSTNELDRADESDPATADEKYAASLDEVLRQHLPKRKLLLLEALVRVLSPLFDEESLPQTDEVDAGTSQIRDTLNDRADSEISIFLVCAEIRVALSLCQHFSKLSSLLVSENNGMNREAVEDLFGKNYFSFDANPKSRGSGRASVNNSTIQDDRDETFPHRNDFRSLDDVINLINTMRFLCFHKWSALGDSFLACTEVGSPSRMQKTMLSTWQNSVHWNEEWID